MRRLLFKALPPACSDEYKLPPDEKMLLILKEYVKRGKDNNERDRAQRELDEFIAGKRRLAP